MHVVMRHRQARIADQTITEQQDVQVQCAWAPAFGFALTAVGLLDGLECIEQGQGWQ